MKRAAVTREDVAKLRDPATFRRVIKLDTDRGPRPASECHDDWQKAEFEALDPAWRHLAGQRVSGEIRQRAWIERPRGHSKSSDQALSAIWALAFSARRLFGVAAAADKDQARLLRDAISKIVAVNPWLTEFIDVQSYKVVGTKSESFLEIQSSDASTSYGLTPDFILLDEVTHWKSRDLWDSLISSAAKRSHCLVVCISNAGWMSDWQWTVREQIRTDPDWLFKRLEGPKASWISAKLLNEQKRLLPAMSYSRLWLNQWSAGSGDALDPAVVDAATRADLRPLIAPEQAWAYFAGVDIGVMRDATAILLLAKHVGYVETITREAKPEPRMRRILRSTGHLPPLFDQVETESIYHPGDGRLKLAGLQVWQPSKGRPVELAEVEAHLIDLHNRFGCEVFADPSQFRPIEQRIRAAGVPVELVNYTASNMKNMATELLSAFNDGRILLYPEPVLRYDIEALRVVEKVDGIRLESPRGNASGQGTPHGDAASAFQLAVLGASNCHGPQRPLTIDGPLVCYP